MPGGGQCEPCNVKNSEGLNQDNAQAGTVLVRFKNEPQLSIKNADYAMELEVIGHPIGNYSREVDVMMVLDVSQSMEGDKLKAMKEAAQHVLTKLGNNDRLSIVTFANDARTIYDFHKVQMLKTELQQKFDATLKSLKASGQAKIGAGLQEALKDINKRTYNMNMNYPNYPVIMLISNGVQFDGCDLNQISLDRFPVFTFDLGPGNGSNPSVLKDIAKGSNAEYNRIDPKNPNYSVLIKCLDEFRRKPIKDVKLILKPLEGTVSQSGRCLTKINQVRAGKYSVSPPDATGSQTVSLGNLEEKERCKVLVNLSLPSVEKQVHIDSLRIFCCFRDEKGIKLYTNPLIFRVKRYDENQLVKYGPFGSKLPETFRVVLEGRERIKEVIIRHSSFVEEISFKRGLPSESTKTSVCDYAPNEHKIVLGSDEHITQISGIFGDHNNQCVIGKLSIHTNKCKYGDYGQGEHMVNVEPFTSPTSGPIIGFFGRSGTNLESIGVFVKRSCGC